MKKKLLVVIMAMGLLAGCGNAVKLENGQEAVVEFKDGSKFSADEIWSEMKKDYALSVVLEKIDKKILEDKYKDKKDEADKYVKNYETTIKANYVDENGKFDEQALNDALTQYGYASIDVLLDQQRNSFYTSLATTDYAKTKVSEKEIKDYYNTKAMGDIHAVHILVSPSGDDDAADKEALAKANEIIAAIKKDVDAGTKIEDAFNKYKDDSSVTYQDLDYFNRGDMVTPFEDAVVAMKDNTYSTKPVKTTYGYHIIYRIDQKEKESYDKAKDSISEKLAKELIDKDSKMSVNAMIELRKEYGVKWDDSELEDSYNKYMNYLINQKD